MPFLSHYYSKNTDYHDKEENILRYNGLQENLQVMEEQQAKRRISYANGNIQRGWNNLGGLVGTNEGEIINCYATGNVRGNQMVGGFIGGNIGAITNCYAIGVV